VEWSPETLRLLAETDALWRRASNQGVVTRDLVEATLLLAGLQLGVPAAAAGSHDGDAVAAERGAVLPTAPAASGTACVYAHTGCGAALADARKSLLVVQETLDACDGLRDRLEAATRGGRADDGAPALEAVGVSVQLVRQNLLAQRGLLVAAEQGLSAGAAATAATAAATAAAAAAGSIVPAN
jgi:hypothetical protein